MAASTGRKSSVGTTAVQLISTATPISYNVTIKAAAANTGKVYVGTSSAVTADGADGTDGIELSAGEAITLPKAFASDASSIYLIASASSQKVFFVVC